MQRQFFMVFLTVVLIGSSLCVGKPIEGIISSPRIGGYHPIKMAKDILNKRSPGGCPWFCKGRYPDCSPCGSPFR
ncbi:unnamed protein product [Rotaria sordida]|uniref:Uncharacterized protein n=1 Tax=Rotaria sordida TaxID=392033 RepID=A0A816DAY5_9BILA|nr:unnamed protein product [Rotaria sordida]CAF1632072.1 unnamed protein product [Rotaria sordida]